MDGDFFRVTGKGVNSPVLSSISFQNPKTTSTSPTPTPLAFPHGRAQQDPPPTRSSDGARRPPSRRCNIRYPTSCRKVPCQDHEAEQDSQPSRQGVSREVHARPTEGLRRLIPLRASQQGEDHRQVRWSHGRSRALLGEELRKRALLVSICTPTVSIGYPRTLRGHQSRLQPCRASRRHPPQRPPHRRWHQRARPVLPSSALASSLFAALSRRKRRVSSLIGERTAPGTAPTTTTIAAR